ncbi:hypothetical protein JDV02_006822 [Purpureocillium takamizusanense]|uniref:F-box domain-containing protein n=1 Tax=Purpureocillium takamizusanense TaxID=2060973 RepID=A0A9Q8VCJ5_9HYPO|nr:uncharacterized protein JDV02_006822 [Purpureocillium takamizusanense]UNI20763.1 hypothetical protein JDV02_006822 [Purpureocillium takamizusanense]
MALLKLPQDVFESVADHLEHRDYVALTKTNRHLHQVFNRRLYWESDRQLRDAALAVADVHDPSGDMPVSREYAKAQDRHPLSWAAARGRKCTFLAAFSAGIDVCRAGFLQRAAAHGQNGIVKFLLRARPSLVDEQSDFFSHPTYHGLSTALHAAVVRNHPDVVETLLKRNADPNAVAEDSCFLDTPLHRAVAHGGQIVIVRMLLTYGASVSAVNVAWRTPLHRAAANCELDIALLLVDEGARIDVTDRQGSTPLNEALLYDSEDFIAALIDRGIPLSTACPPLVDALLRSSVRSAQVIMQRFPAGPLDHQLHLGHKVHALLLAASCLCYSPRCYEAIASVVIAILNRGVHVDLRDTQGRTPLHHAVLQSNGPLARLLISRGANLLATDMLKVTPFALALKRFREKGRRLEVTTTIGDIINCLDS